LLEVNAEIEQTGVQRELLIYDPDAMTAEDVARRRAELAHLKIHPRDSDAAKAVLARAGRCIEAALGAEREMLNMATARFEAVLSAQDPRAVKQAIDELVAILDQFEGASYL
jgi:molecular chaperone HscC